MPADCHRPSPARTIRLPRTPLRTRATAPSRTAHAAPGWKLQCAAEPGCHAQVRLRPNGVYQLEYRDRSPAEHCRTQTLSVDKVIAALADWAAGEIAWRDAFHWDSIGA
ncbi:hypothetical protein [Streptomyces sp. NPDC002547]